MAEGRSRAGWGSVLAGAASVATLPLAVYATRFSNNYDLLHSGFAVPIAALFGVAAIALARRAERRSSLRLSGGRPRTAALGRVLGVTGLCVAASALVALGVYGLLEYVGSRD